MNTRPHTATARMMISLGLMASGARMKNSLVGRWRVTDRRSPVLVCAACERRYITTREGQDRCLFCMWGRPNVADFRPEKKDDEI